MTPSADMAVLILAAGFSSRMKRFKPLLPLGEISAVERCVRLFREVGIEDVRVIVGYKAAVLEPVLKRLNVRRVMNFQFEEGMFSSIIAGVRALGPSTNAFFLMPVDIPLVRRSTILDLIAARDAEPADVWFPTFTDKRGHPPLISTALSGELLSWNGEGGLRGFLNRDAVERRHVAVADEHILMDMDGPRQYEALVEALIDYEVPSASERTALLTEKLRIPESVAVHSRKVADIALRVSQALNDQGRRLNTKLVESVGLLGNSAIRSRSAVVSELLKEMGCPAVSRIVGNPTDMISDGQGAITVEEIVCFADAIVQPYTTVSVEQTQPVGITPCEVVSGPAESLETRLAIVSGIRRRLEKELGAPIETVINPAIMDL